MLCAGKQEVQGMLSLFKTLKLATRSQFPHIQQLKMKAKKKKKSQKSAGLAACLPICARKQTNKNWMA